MKPLVSVICVSYNHARFVVEALESVKSQTYSNVELIIVDDGSSDDSAVVIQQWMEKNPKAIFLNLKQNIGYTKAFNKAFQLAKGEFYIDLAADDVLLPNRIEKGVAGFLEKGNRYAIQFSDANFIDTEGKFLGKHSDKFPHATIPQGDVYAEVLQRYFICSPTMLVRKSTLDALGGYDENLVYEDFNLWVRIGRDYQFFYIEDALVNRRIVHNSMSSGWYKRGDKQLMSTWQICKNAISLNRNNADWNAWAKRVKYELRQSVFSQNYEEAIHFYELLKEVGRFSIADQLLNGINKLKLPLAGLRNIYHRWRY
jgi:glycosyltransferase involved in cell wall biosynthesis